MADAKLAKAGLGMDEATMGRRISVRNPHGIERTGEIVELSTVRLVERGTEGFRLDAGGTTRAHSILVQFGAEADSMRYCWIGRQWLAVEHRDARLPVTIWSADGAIRAMRREKAAEIEAKAAPGPRRRPSLLSGDAYEAMMAIEKARREGSPWSAVRLRATEAAWHSLCYGENAELGLDPVTVLARLDLAAAAIESARKMLGAKA